MNPDPNRAFHRETVLHSGFGDEKIVRHQADTTVYAGIRIEVRPLPRGQGVVFTWNADYSIPDKFVSAVVKGVHNTLNAGVVSGFEVIDVLVTVEDGSYHEVDSTEAAFQEVAREATMVALRRAQPIVLESISKCGVTFPPEFAGDVETTAKSFGGTVDSSRPEASVSTAIITVPTARATQFLQQLVAVTRGQASVTIEPAGFRASPNSPDIPNAWVSVT